jgi:hypothetical protein
VRRLVEIIDQPDKSDDEFVIVPPGSQIRQEMFWDFQMVESQKQQVVTS